MTEFVFDTMPIAADIARDGTVYKQTILHLNAGGEERRIVEAKNLKELQPLFDQYVKDQAATGKPLHCTTGMRFSRDRKPPGFDKAVYGGGTLACDVNWDKAVETARAEWAKKYSPEVAA
jgi:hypothetical protein